MWKRGEKKIIEDHTPLPANAIKLYNPHGKSTGMLVYTNHTVTFQCLPHRDTAKSSFGHCQRLKADFFNDIDSSCSKSFWKSVRAVRGSKTSSVPVLIVNGTSVTSNSCKANFLNSSLDASTCQFLLYPVVLCSEKDVASLLGAVDTSKSSGPDGISARMLKQTAHSAAPSVARHFNLSLSTGRVPLE